jgi:enoyl-CoA hydratase
LATATPDTVSVERLQLAGTEAWLGLVTLNRPESLNPLSWGTVLALGDAFDQLAVDPDVRLVAVTGAGRAFSAGGDLKQYQTLQRDRAGFAEFLRDLHALFARMSQYPKPYLALVNGIAVAGGFELLLYCDLAFAAESARIGDAHQPYGQMGGGGVLAMLPHVVGPARARDLIISGRTLSAREALDWGLVSRVVPNGSLLATALEFGSTLATRSPLAVANAKRVLNEAFWEANGINSGMRLELETTARYCATSEDVMEGLSAFAEKRSPRFAGR